MLVVAVVVDMQAHKVLVEQVEVGLQEILESTEQITLVAEVVEALLQQQVQVVLEEVV
tara:strand:+ start:500 stop:673 length:174 start_codon:yes stop_codon:yes gene_type:complete